MSSVLQKIKLILPSFILSILFAISVIADTSIPLSEKIRSFESIVFDVRGSRGGKGDVAASYLTAMDLIERGDYKGKITFIVDDKSQEILSNLLSQKIEPGSKTKSGVIEFHSAETIPHGFKPPDMYLYLASPSGTIKYADDFEPYSKTRYMPRGIPVDDDTMIVVHTVLGNTENPFSLNPNAVVKMGNNKYSISAAGLAPNEQGIYYDPVANILRGKTDTEIRSYLLDSLADIQDKEKREILQNILNNKALQGSDLTLAYGISDPKVKSQFVSYLKGLYKSASEEGRSFTLITPSGFALNEISSFGAQNMKKNIHVFSYLSELPAKTIPGHIYIVKTGALPHKTFVGLMAYSKVPYVIAGDGAMSAAINIGKPFVLTRVEWNKKNISNLINRLAANAKTEDEAKLYKSIFGFQLDLGRALELQNHGDAFVRLQNEIPMLTDSM